MGSKRGVYVVNDKDGECALRANDVILKVGDREIRDLKDFFEAIKKLHGPVSITIYRNQQESVILLDSTL